MKPVLFGAAAALALASCSPPSAQGDAAAAASSAPAAAAPRGAASPSLPASSEEPAGDRVLTPGGLGRLRIGAAVPAGSGWAERGAQSSDSCRIATSPDYPGVYAIVEGGAVRRISVSEPSNVVLAEGIGPGAARSQVEASFPGLSEARHEYIAGGHYLTSAAATRDRAGLRFELDEKGFVTIMHIGTLPVLTYTEGCA